MSELTFSLLFSSDISIFYCLVSLAWRLLYIRCVTAQAKGKNAAWVIFLAILFWHTPIYSDTLEEKWCGKLYEESLERAKNALQEGKREEAVRFLLDADAIIKRCSSFPERPHLENQEKEPAQAFYSAGRDLTWSALEEEHRSLWDQRPGLT